MGRGKVSKNKRKKFSGCSFIVCEDIETGEIILVPSKNCPAGFVQKAKSGMKEKGVLFANEYPAMGLDYDDVSKRKRHYEKT